MVVARGLACLNTALSDVDLNIQHETYATNRLRDYHRHPHSGDAKTRDVSASAEKASPFSFCGKLEKSDVI